MKHTPIKPNLDGYPSVFHPLLKNAPIYDSSSSTEARVIYIQKDDGYFLKSAARGSLHTEAELTRFFHQKRLGAEVLSYISEEKDWLLTKKVAGEDATHAAYLENPIKLCDILAESLRKLHNLNGDDCPVPDRIKTYHATAERNYRAGMFDYSLFPDRRDLSSAAETWKIVENGKHLLKKDTLLHGDYCLPNIMLDRWNFSGFIDVGNGGMGDRHIDLFWGAWSLAYNLKTDRYRERFFDAYGRSDIDEEVLRVIAAIEMFG